MSEQVIVGLEELEAKLGRTIPADALRDLLEEASTIAVREAVAGVDGGAGVAVRSIARDVQPLTARVYSAMPRPRQESIELGRPAGEPVEATIAQITRWKKAVGHPEPARVIAEGIRDRGVKGRFFMANAKQKTEEALPTLLSTLASKIEGNWEK